MSKADFTPEEFRNRRLLVRQAMETAGLDWLVVFHPVSIHWLTGSEAKSYQEFQCLFISTVSDEISVLTREGERCEFEQDALVDQLWTWGGGEIEDPMMSFRRVAQLLKISRARVGIEVPAYYMHPKDYVRLCEFLGASLVAEPSNLIADLKLVKSPQELEYIKEATRLADVAMEVFVRELRVGRTELELAGEVYGSLFKAGSGIAASPINLVSGDRSCFSHGAPTTRVMQADDFGSIEYGATWRRYTSTIGRQFCLGRPSARMLELYKIVRDASEACRHAIRAGVPASQPHAVAKKVIGDAGLEAGRVHTTGYGLAPGFPPTWGEPLHMLESSNYTLEAGMVITVEPPVFLGDEKLGARLIDNVLVTEDGCELLTGFSADLIVKE